MCRTSVARAREAQKSLESLSQAQVDDIVTAVAWVGVHRRGAARQSCRPRDGARQRRRQDPEEPPQNDGNAARPPRARAPWVCYGTTPRPASPRSRSPSVSSPPSPPVTNPGATPINNIMITLKGRNAVILAPHPKADGTCAELVRLVREELDKLGITQRRRPAALVEGKRQAREQSADAGAHGGRRSRRRHGGSW